mgnify:CR=1 FL=1
MTVKSYAGIDVDLDEQGYLTDATQWTPAVGEAIADELGVSLTPMHWEVVNFAREDYADRGQSPGLRRIVANTSAAMRDIYKMFPKGPGKLVARVAGTPKPKSCL